MNFNIGINLVYTGKTLTGSRTTPIIRNNPNNDQGSSVGGDLTRQLSKKLKDSGLDWEDGRLALMDRTKTVTLGRGRCITFEAYNCDQQSDREGSEGRSVCRLRTIMPVLLESSNRSACRRLQASNPFAGEPSDDSEESRQLIIDRLPSSNRTTHKNRQVVKCSSVIRFDIPDFTTKTQIFTKQSHFRSAGCVSFLING